MSEQIVEQYTILERLLLACDKRESVILACLLRIPVTDLIRSKYFRSTYEDKMVTLQSIKNGKVTGYIPSSKTTSNTFNSWYCSTILNQYRSFAGNAYSFTVLHQVNVDIYYHTKISIKISEYNIGIYINRTKRSISKNITMMQRSLLLRFCNQMHNFTSYCKTRMPQVFDEIVKALNLYESECIVEECTSLYSCIPTTILSTPHTTKYF